MRIAEIVSRDKILLPIAPWMATSYICFGFASAHGVYAGTDRRNLLFMVFGSGLLFVLAFATVARYLQGRAKHAQRQTQRATA